MEIDARSALDRVATIVSGVERSLAADHTSDPSDLYGALFDAAAIILRIERADGFEACANYAERLYSLWLRAVAVGLITVDDYAALVRKATLYADSSPTA